MTKQSSLKDFQILQKLGEGSFSVVYRVKRILDGQEYALKKVKMNMLKEKEKQNSLNEVRLLASIEDDYIVAYKEAFIDEESQTLCIVMELLQGGDVLKKITSAIKYNEYPFTEKDIWRALVHMTKGLKALHELNIVHRDLKCANIFLSLDGKFKLGDLNVSKIAKKGLVYTQTGTPYYASPEVWRDEPYDIKSDIWSLGCVLYEMATLKPPFRANDMEQLFKKVQKGLYDQLPTRYSRELGEVIGLMLRINPNSRPTCGQLLNHRFVQRNYDFSEIEIKSKKAELLKTIQLPRNFKFLKERLPKVFEFSLKYYQAKYENNMNRSLDRSPHSQALKKRTSRYQENLPLNRAQSACINNQFKKIVVIQKQSRSTSKEQKAKQPNSSQQTSQPQQSQQTQQTQQSQQPQQNSQQYSVIEKAKKKINININYYQKDNSKYPSISQVKRNLSTKENSISKRSINSSSILENIDKNKKKIGLYQNKIVISAELNKAREKSPSNVSNLYTPSNPSQQNSNNNQNIFMKKQIRVPLSALFKRAEQKQIQIESPQSAKPITQQLYQQFPNYSPKIQLFSNRIKSSKVEPSHVIQNVFPNRVLKRTLETAPNGQLENSPTNNYNHYFPIVREKRNLNIFKVPNREYFKHGAY